MADVDISRLIHLKGKYYLGCDKYNYHLYKKGNKVTKLIGSTPTLRKMFELVLQDHLKENFHKAKGIEELLLQISHAENYTRLIIKNLSNNLKCNDIRELCCAKQDKKSN
jgi:hypothetical protein